MSDILFEPQSLTGDLLQMVHLPNGEDVIGFVSVGDDGYVTVSDPVAPHISMDQMSGSVRIGLIPFRPYLASKSLRIAQSQIAFIADVSPDMANAHRQYHSKIVVPPTPNLSDILR